MKFDRIPWDLLGGLLLGIALGLLYAWVISPVHFVDTNPATLRSDFKDQYRLVIAASYAATGDLGRAQARLALLGDPDPFQALTAQAQQMLADGQTQENVRALAILAGALQQANQPATDTPVPTLTPGISNATSTQPAAPVRTATLALTPTPIYSPTPRPTHTPTPTIGAPFVLNSQESVCDPKLQPGLLQVNVENAAGKPVAGAEIIITWSGGEEHFFTGFKPELGNGYADYAMTPGLTYAIRLGDGSTSVTDLTAPSCKTEGGDPYWGGISLDFRQP
jgi:hypothetical protein